jgi:mannose-6-phosphate isomerase-like protein (cupin superfamily)
MAKIEVRNFETPDQHREIPNGTVDDVKAGPVEIGRAVFQPGWRWSNDVKPISQTDRCMFHHVGIVLSGRGVIQDDEGNEVTVGPGDLAVIEPGHDAWVTGDEPWVFVDFGKGSTTYATPPS